MAVTRKREREGERRQARSHGMAPRPAPASKALMPGLKSQSTQIAPRKGSK